MAVLPKSLTFILLHISNNEDYVISPSPYISLS